MKKCTTCHIFKDENQFAWKNKVKEVKHSRCKACQKIASDAWYSVNVKKHIANVNNNNERYYQDAREWLKEYLDDHPCVDCGEADKNVLEFDHRNPDTKKCSISNMFRRGYGLQRFKEEIAKCDVRCANCHRRRTRLQFGYFTY